MTQRAHPRRHRVHYTLLSKKIKTKKSLGIFEKSGMSGICAELLTNLNMEFSHLTILRKLLDGLVGSDWPPPFTFSLKILFLTRTELIRK